MTASAGIDEEGKPWECRWHHWELGYQPKPQARQLKHPITLRPDLESLVGGIVEEGTQRAKLASRLEEIAGVDSVWVTRDDDEGLLVIVLTEDASWDQRVLVSGAVNEAFIDHRFPPSISLRPPGSKIPQGARPYYKRLVP